MIISILRVSKQRDSEVCLFYVLTLINHGYSDIQYTCVCSSTSADFKYTHLFCTDEDPLGKDMYSTLSLIEDTSQV